MSAHPAPFWVGLGLVIVGAGLSGWDLWQRAWGARHDLTIPQAFKRRAKIVKRAVLGKPQPRVDISAAWLQVPGATEPIAPPQWPSGGDLLAQLDFVRGALARLDARDEAIADRTEEVRFAAATWRNEHQDVIQEIQAAIRESPREGVGVQALSLFCVSLGTFVLALWGAG